MIYWIAYKLVKLIGKINIKLTCMKNIIFIYCAKNLIMSDDIKIDNTLRLAIMFKNNISYSKLQEWFTHEYPELEKTRIIEVLYHSTMFETDIHDDSVYKLRIDFNNNTIHKFLNDYWLIEDVVFNDISFNPPIPETHEVYNCENFLEELEELSEI